MSTKWNKEEKVYKEKQIDGTALMQEINLGGCWGRFSLEWV